MKKSIIFCILILCLLIASFFMGKHFGNSTKIEIKDTIPTIIEKIIIKNDSILRVNDSINFKVIEIERTYEKTVDDIIRNNPDDDYNFFSAYIERYCSSNNSDAIKDS